MGTIAFWEQFEACIDGVFELRFGLRRESNETRYKNWGFVTVSSLGLQRDETGFSPLIEHAPLQECGEVLIRSTSNGTQICGGKPISACRRTVLIFLCVPVLYVRESMNVFSGGTDKVYMIYAAIYKGGKQTSQHIDTQRTARTASGAHEYFFGAHISFSFCCINIV